jgi:hypothetical protein
LNSSRSSPRNNHRSSPCASARNSTQSCRCNSAYSSPCNRSTNSSRSSPRFGTCTNTTSSRRRLFLPYFSPCQFGHLHSATGALEHSTTLLRLTPARFPANLRRGRPSLRPFLRTFGIRQVPLGDFVMPRIFDNIGLDPQPPRSIIPIA